MFSATVLILVSAVLSSRIDMRQAFAALAFVMALMYIARAVLLLLTKEVR